MFVFQDNSRLKLIIYDYIFCFRSFYILKNNILENRARNISKELRCLVCQNEDIDNSNADIARDLRLLIRKKLLEGETEKEIVYISHMDMNLVGQKVL